MLTHPAATATLKRLAHGLAADRPGVERLMERLASQDQDDLRVLTSLLLEVGALALLAGAPVLEVLEDVTRAARGLAGRGD